jgi:hypothetical protein
VALGEALFQIVRLFHVVISSIIASYPFIRLSLTLYNLKN